MDYNNNARKPLLATFYNGLDDEGAIVLVEGKLDYVLREAILLQQRAIKHQIDVKEVPADQYKQVRLQVSSYKNLLGILTKYDKETDSYTHEIAVDWTSPLNYQQTDKFKVTNMSDIDKLSQVIQETMLENIVLHG